MSKKCVWVLEIGIYHATLPKISSWEVWESFNTRKEAVAARNASQTPMRIVKYVPAEEHI